MDQKRKHNPALTQNAKALRKNMTKEERRLWFAFRRSDPVRFLRQKVIDRYIADFYCHAARLVIELDGSQHYEETGILRDRIRTARIENRGITVVRIPNSDVNRHFEGVCEYIDKLVQERLRRDGIPQSHVAALVCQPPLGKGANPPPPAAEPPLGKGANKETMKTVEIYTDGACSGNPGPGGWGAVLRYQGKEKELSGGEADTTNNRMELTGVIRALEALKEPCVVELWSDSKYVIDGLEKGWARGWQKRGWIKADKKPALNADLWQRLLELTEVHQMHYHWVRGHADNAYNKRCDALAVAAREAIAKEGSP